MKMEQFLGAELDPEMFPRSVELQKALGEAFRAGDIEASFTAVAFAVTEVELDAHKAMLAAKNAPTEVLDLEVRLRRAGLEFADGPA